MENLPQRPTYSKSQIEKYFSRISLPQRYRGKAFEIARSNDTDIQLDFLTSLQQHQLCNVPFENLSIHYSPHHTVSIDADHLYTKIVDNARGRGGYCMENNCFFGTILRTLGFNVYSVGGRIADAVNGLPGGGYGAWSHMIIIVTLPSAQAYMVDVGFGSDGPIRPLPLLNSLETGNTYPGIGAQQLHLIHDSIANTTNRNPSQKLWIFQRRHSPADDWLTAYCFTELEFLPKDYAMMNYYTSTSRTVFFTYAIIAVKMIMEAEEVVGQVILSGGEIKRRIKGVTEHLVTCKGEGERVEALERWFGVKITGEERRGIAGTVTELKS